MTALKLSVHIRGNAFSAEGPENLVRDEFLRFLEFIQTKDTAAAEPSFQLAPPLNKVFWIAGTSVPCLLKLPETDDYVLDSLLLLLLGNEKVEAALHEPHSKHQGFFPDQPTKSVQAGRLMAGARRSGLVVERLDRTIAANRDLVIKFGAKRGTRYQLTKAGRARAEKLLSDLSQ